MAKGYNGSRSEMTTSDPAGPSDHSVNQLLHKIITNGSRNSWGEKRKSSIRMTKKIRLAIDQFTRSNVVPADHQRSDNPAPILGPPGTTPWNDALLVQLVNQTNLPISIMDINRWLVAHGWIKDIYYNEIQERRYAAGQGRRGTPVSSMDTVPPITPTPAPAPPPQPTPSPAPATTTMPTTTTAPERPKTKLEQLTELLPGFRQMGEFFEENDELRAQTIAFGQMSRAISRYMEKLLAGKSYRELHGEGLGRMKMEVGSAQLAEREQKFRPNFYQGRSSSAVAAIAADYGWNGEDVVEIEDIVID